jgi:hypothetical protein
MQWLQPVKNDGLKKATGLLQNPQAEYERHQAARTASEAPKAANTRACVPTRRAPEFQTAATQVSPALAADDIGEVEEEDEADFLARWEAAEKDATATEYAEDAEADFLTLWEAGDKDKEAEFGHIWGEGQGQGQQDNDNDNDKGKARDVPGEGFGGLIEEEDPMEAEWRRLEEEKEEDAGYSSLEDVNF